MNNTEDHFEDEIELIDYLRVMWKWKWLIIVGTLSFALAAAIYSYTRPVVKMYKVSALIEVDPEAKLDPLDKIKSMIDYGLFDQRVLDGLSNLQETSKIDHLNFEVTIPKGLNILAIEYKTANPGLGRAVLKSLVEQLDEEYAQQVKSQFDKKIDNISMHIAQVEALQEQVRLIEASMDHTRKVLQEAQSSSDKISTERKAILLDPDDRKNRADSIMEAAAVNEVIDYPLKLRDRMNILIAERNNASKEIMCLISTIKELASGVAALTIHEGKKSEDDQRFISELKSRIDSFKQSGEQLTGVIVGQPPTVSAISVKNKAKLNVVLAGTFGFFLVLFLTFFVEYVQRHRVTKSRD